VTPLLPIAGGLLALLAAALVLRSYGPRYRVARLLATVPAVTLEEALGAAASAKPPYLRVDGRVDSEESFEDAARRPLVFRRTRLQVRSKGRWVTFEDSREQVPFEVGDGLRAIAIDADALLNGLVVIPRESTGRAADLGDRAPSDLSPDAPVRAIVEQISAVEQASVLGVPSNGPDGTVQLTSGAGRPLILSTLDEPAAMRILGGGGRVRPFLALALLVASVGLLAIGFGWLVFDLVVPAVVSAASPSPTQASGGDTRSPLEGPGLVGNPVAAMVAVLAIAIFSILVTAAYVRLTGGRSPGPPPTD
jgi:hypothetical protein